jgi:ribosomal protein S10
MDETALNQQAAYLAAKATSRITAELGPRALPTQKDRYLYAAQTIAEEVIGDDWEFRVNLDMEGKAHVMLGQYRG